jgi:anti-anti-sigma factor
MNSATYTFGVSKEPLPKRDCQSGDSESVGVEYWKSNRMPAMEIEPFRVVTQPGTRDGLHVLTLRGALTSTSSPAFTEAVIGVAAPRLIVDLTGVPMVDSVAIGALVRAFVSCHKSGRKLALVGMNLRFLRNRDASRKGVGLTSRLAEFNNVPVNFGASEGL